MKTYSKIILTLLISSFLAMNTSQIVYAQTEKVDEAVQKLLGTKFMSKFLDMRARAESAVSEFKANQARFQGETGRVEKAYTEIAGEFNAVLLNIQADLLNKKKRKFIAKFPDSYAKGLEADLYRLNESYDAVFRQALLDATDGQIDGIPLIPLLVQLLAITDEFAALIADLRKYGRKFTEQHLTENFYLPNQFKSWEAIEVGQSTIQNNNDDWSQPNTTNENSGWNEPNMTNENSGWNEPNMTNEVPQNEDMNQIENMPSEEVPEAPSPENN